MSALAEGVPSLVEKFVRSLPACPVALIGCRAGDASFDCCEYDLAVFSEESKDNQMIHLDGHTLELLYFAGHPKNYVIELYGMTIVRDSNNFTLASAAREMTQERFRKSLNALGRKLLVSSLFYQRNMTSSRTPVPAMWAKIASYRFISGLVALSGRRPMPLHELDQSRQINAAGPRAEGLQDALECIGIERATRPTISRSLEALRELQSANHDIDLVMSKIEHLLRRQMLTDCYYYVGRTAGENLAKRTELFYRQYGKLIQLGLDLTSDMQQLEKLQRGLFKTTNAILKE